MSANDKLAAALHPLAEAFTEWGVQTPGGTVLVVTEVLDEAEAALEWILGGRIVARTVTRGRWAAQ